MTDPSTSSVCTEGLLSSDSEGAQESAISYNSNFTTRCPKSVQFSELNGQRNVLTNRGGKHRKMLNDYVENV